MRFETFSVSCCVADTPETWLATQDIEENAPKTTNRRLSDHTLPSCCLRSWSVIELFSTGLNLPQRTRKGERVLEIIVYIFLEDVEAIVVLKKADISNLVRPRSLDLLATA